MTEKQAAAPATPAADEKTTPTADPPAAPTEPKGIDATDPTSSSAFAWIPGTVIEKYEGVVSVMFDTEEGSTFTVTLIAPRWTTDANKVAIGDTIAVKCDLFPRKGAYAVAGGHGFYPKA